MPRKSSKNAYYYFRLDFKIQQRKKGICYENLYELSVAVDPVWRDAAPDVKEKYKEIAKSQKEKKHVSDGKFTNTGVSSGIMRKKEIKPQEAEEAERKDIYNLVQLKINNGAMVTGDIFVMDVNFYCKVKSTYLIGESTILRFNLNTGIGEAYHEHINPGYISPGYANYVKHACIKQGLQPLEKKSKPSNYLHMLSNIFNYLKDNDRASNILPPIYIMPDRLPPAKDFIQQICNAAGEDVSQFKLYKIDTLFFMLMNSIKTHDKQGFPHESLALEQLKMDMFKHAPGIGCAHHEKIEMSVECSLSRANRLAYTILDSCCPIVGVKMEPGKHFPFLYSTSDSQRYYQQVKETPIPIRSSAVEMSTYNTFTLSQDFGETLTLNSYNHSHVNKECRLPQTPMADYSQIFRAAPDLTKANFPELCANHGRDCGGVRGFNKFGHG